MVMAVMMATWMALILAGIAGLGLGIGVVVGAAIVRNLRGRNGDFGGKGRHL